MNYLLEGEQTERLQFRLLQSDDFNTWLEFFKDAHASRFLHMQHLGTAQAQCEEWFKRVFERYENNSGGMNILIDKSTNEFIGQCGLLIQTIDDIEELEIGYSLLPQYWNKGYATEAAQKCRDFAFENNLADSLISIIHKDNIQSEKVAIKNGMQKTKKTSFKGVPVNIFRIEKTDWQRMNT